MTWADFYLACFALGFAFTVLAFVFGGDRWHLLFHVRWTMEPTDTASIPMRRRS
jgi:hypothetical protein